MKGYRTSREAALEKLSWFIIAVALQSSKSQSNPEGTKPASRPQSHSLSAGILPFLGKKEWEAEHETLWDTPGSVSTAQSHYCVIWLTAVTVHSLPTQPCLQLLRDLAAQSFHMTER